MMVRLPILVPARVAPTWQNQVNMLSPAAIPVWVLAPVIPT